MEIDRGSPVPLYEQLARILRAQIADGARVIPSIKRLSQEHDLGETTVRKAISVLREEGLVVAVPGKGTYAVPPT